METVKLDILQIILESGPVVKLVLLLLIVASVASWAIVLNRHLNLKKIRRSNAKFLHHFRNSSSMKEIMQNIDSFAFSPNKRMFQHAYTELINIKTTVGEEKNKLKKHFEEFGLGAIERSLKQGVNESNLALDNHLSVLASIGSISPFIGLFGTVWGIIDSFAGLATGGSTLNAVAPGIAEALVATAVGLAAAIPAVWFYNIYSGENTKLNSDMENFGQEFLNIVERSITG